MFPKDKKTPPAVCRRLFRARSLPRELIYQIIRESKISDRAVILNEVSRTADPALSAKKSEHTADLAFKLLSADETEHRLYADAAEYRELIAVSVKIKIVRHLRALLPRMHAVDAELGYAVRYL